jgi:hypothetical protein
MRQSGSGWTAVAARGWGKEWPLIDSGRRERLEAVVGTIVLASMGTVHLVRIAGIAFPDPAR